MLTQQTSKIYNYSILSDFFPDNAIDQFRESAINPVIALLNAEFVEGGDKAIAELLHAVPNDEKFTNNGVLRSKHQQRYDSVIKDGGISFRGKSIDGAGATKCISFKPVTPSKAKDGDSIKYENPPKIGSQAILPLIDVDTWKSISSRCGVEMLSDVDITRTWQPEEIGDEEWRDYHELDLGKKVTT